MTRVYWRRSTDEVNEEISTIPYCTLMDHWQQLVQVKQTSMSGDFTLCQNPEPPDYESNAPTTQLRRILHFG